MSLTSLFTEIADAIREKNGSTEGIPASEFPEKIREISSGTGEVLHNISAGVDWLGAAYRVNLTSSTALYMSRPYVAYGDGVWAMVDAGDQKSTILRSEDGFNWQEVQVPGSKTYWISVAFGAGRFIATDGYDGIYSVDGGLTWQSCSWEDVINREVSHLVWCHDRFILFSYDWKRYYYSFDGVNWVSGTFPAAVNNCTICWAFDKFFIQLPTSGIVYYSSDFVTWQSRNNGSGNSHILYGNEKVIVLTTGGKFIYETTDGTTWVKKNITVSKTFSSVAASLYAFGMFVVFNDNRCVSYSEDGIIWTQTNSPFGGIPIPDDYAISDSIAITPLEDASMYLVTFNGTITR